jgi:signal transduction histidine kinase
MNGPSEPVAIVTSCEDITERKRIDIELEESREQMRSLALHLQTVREGERIRIARDIHDELGQILSVFKLDFSWINKRLREDQKPLIGKIKEVSELVDGAIDSVQRICSELRPTLLDDVGIVAGMEWQAGELQNRTGIECKVSLELDDVSLDKNVSIDIFRIFQEALTNVVRHAGATRIDARVKVDNDKLILEIQDNGRGINEDEISGSKSFGLMGMRERVYSWGGELHINGIAGKGTTILVSVPLDEKGGFR